MVTKEEFNKVWKDSSRKDILNQFYYEHIAIRKAIEYIKENATSNYFDGKINMFRREIDLLNILQNGSDTSE